MKTTIRRTLAPLLALTLAAGSIVAFTGTAQAVTVPWTKDAVNEVAELGLFDSAGNPVAGGSINDAPFVSYVQVKSALRAGDTKATLFGFLPQNGTAPGAWTGAQLSGSTTYPVATAPTALATSALPLVKLTASDGALSLLTGDLPNSATDAYEGLYQLRVRTSAAGVSAGPTYGAAVIKVTGSTWTILSDTPATTTTLGVAPLGSAAPGASVTITATVAPSAATGSVQFKDGGVDLGSPVEVVSGVAQLVTTTLAAGAHSFTAAFTPTNDYLASQTTSPTAYTIGTPPTNSVAPKITGTARVGLTITGNRGTWADATSYTYAWLRNGVVVSGRTGTTYPLAVADYAKTIAFRVTAINSVGSVVRTTSAIRISLGTFKNTKAPALKATPKVGVSVGVNVGTWSPKPSKYTYQWLLNGKSISKATKSTYKPTKSQKGKSLSVKITVYATGYTTTSKTTSAKKIG